MKALSDFEAGREAARLLWERGLDDRPDYVDPLSDDFARGALAELEQLQLSTARVLQEVLEGAQMSAEQLNVESFHGITEVIQNADDLGASRVHIAVRGGRYPLLAFRHDGERVQLHHVIAMSLAFLSTKRKDPRSKGRFGIGLKTLGRLSSRMTVHCDPYHFVIDGSQVRATSSKRGHLNHDVLETLIELELEANLDEQALKNWIEGLGPEALLFLDSVRVLEYTKAPATRPTVRHELRSESSEQAKLPLGISTRITRLADPASGRSWSVVTTDRPVPTGVHRRHKAMGATSPVGIAIPESREPFTGRLYAGLPLQIETGLPFSINGQFDVDVARSGLQHESLNKWIIDEAASLVASVALHRFADSPRNAWQVVPLTSDLAVEQASWLGARCEHFVSAAQGRVRRNLRVLIGSDKLRPGRLAYEHSSLRGLLSQHDVDALVPGKTLIPANARDRGDRWRLVLKELGTGREIAVSEALTMLDRSDDDLGPRSVEWLISLAAAALDENLGNKLWALRSVLTAQGERIVPPMVEEEGEILCRSTGVSSLPFELGLAHVIHEAYLTDKHLAVRVREWLEENEMLRDAPDPEATLLAIVTKAESTGLIDLTDAQLRSVRDELSQLEKATQSKLGPALGQSITIDVLGWERGRKVPSRAAPSKAYLPLTIERRRDGMSWARVANKTAGLLWIHTRYEDLLRTDRGRPRSGDERRTLGPLNFLRLLGAEIAPRLEEPEELHTRYDDPASPLNFGALPGPQVKALNSLERHATHIKFDRQSPDLQNALEDISKDRSRRSREARARTLLFVLDREWERLYAPHTEASAVFSQNSWRSAGQIPATWIASAADVPWLTSEDGKKKRPAELAVRTPATQAVFGDDRSVFAAEVDQALASSPLIRALGINTDPQVSEVLEQLVRLRDEEGVIEPEAALVRYAAIAAAVRRADLAPDEMVGDVTVRQLRGRFGSSRSKRGLVLVNGSWLSPSRVMLGRPIFADRRSFAPGPRSLDRLWRLLKIAPPTLPDCIEVLKEVSTTSIEVNENVVVNTYVYLNDLLKEAKAKEKQLLARLPLWTGSGWHTKRPVYAVDDSALASSLSVHVSVWLAPLPPRTIPHLVEAVGVTRLPTDAFTASSSSEAYDIGEAYREHWSSAVDLLRDWLTRHDPSVAASNDQWTELSTARLSIDPELTVKVRLDGGKGAIAARSSAHLSRDPLTLYVAGDELLSEDEVVGRLIAETFSHGDPDKIALAWSRAWSKAAVGERARVALVDEQPVDDDVSAIFEQAKSESPIKRKAARKEAGGDSSMAKSESDYKQLEPRRLKQIEDLVDKDVRLLSESDGEANGSKPRKGAGLRRTLPTGRPIGGTKPASTTAPKAYSDREKEDLGLEVLQLAINGHSQEMRDYRHLRGTGADALDRLRRFFELKAHYGPMPNDISLTDAEHKRAVEERGKFVLAVVAGLEEGYETVVKVIPDPLRNLSFKPSTSITLTGIRGATVGVEVRLTADSSPKDDSHGERASRESTASS